MLRSLGFIGKGIRKPGNPCELGGNLVVIRYHGGNVEDGV